MKLIFLLFFCLIAQAGLSQSTGKPQRLGDSCETISSKLDYVGAEYNKKGTKNSFIIIIGRFPTSRRMTPANILISDAIRYLVKFHKVERHRIKFGIDSSQTKSGEMEFFINGESSTVLSVAGSRLCFGIGETFTP